MLTAILPKTGSGIGAYLSRAPPAQKHFKNFNVAMYWSPGKSNEFHKDRFESENILKYHFNPYFLKFSLQSSRWNKIHAVLIKKNIYNI